MCACKCAFKWQICISGIIISIFSHFSFSQCIAFSRSVHLVLNIQNFIAYFCRNWPSSTSQFMLYFVLLPWLKKTSDFMWFVEVQKTVCYHSMVNLDLPFGKNSPFNVVWKQTHGWKKSWEGVIIWYFKEPVKINNINSIIFTRNQTWYVHCSLVYRAKFGKNTIKIKLSFSDK